MNELELQQQLDKQRNDYKKRYDSYPTKTMADGQSAKDIPASDIEGLKAEMDAIDKTAEQYDLAVKARMTAEEADAWGQKKESPVNRLGGPLAAKDSKSVLERGMDVFTKSMESGNKGKFNDVEIAMSLEEVKAFMGGNLEFKTDMTTAAGFTPQSIRTGEVVPAIYRPVQLLDFLQIAPTDQNAVVFMQQTTRTSAAAEKAENVALAEAALEYTEATTPIRKVGHYIPVTEEQLEDVDGIRALVQNDMVAMVRERLDLQCAVGNGTSPNIRGLYNASSVQSQARGTDTALDAIFKAIYNKVKTTGRANANLIVMHSADFVNTVLSVTSDGKYLWGDPMNSPVQRIWGLPVAINDGLTATNAMVTDTRFSKVRIRKDVTLAVSDSHDTYFVYNKLAIRAHMRAGLQIHRDEATCRVTGLPA